MQVYGGDGLRHRHLSCQYLLLEHHLDIVFESFEGDEDHRDVVERAFSSGSVEDLIADQA